MHRTTIQICHPRLRPLLSKESSRLSVLYSTKSNDLDIRADEYQYLEKSRLPSYHFQKSLPRLPIPPLQETCQRYLKAQKPLLSAKEHKEVTKITEKFQKGIGKELDTKLRDKDGNNKGTSYISEDWFHMYLSSRVPLPINFNPAIIFADTPGSQLKKSALLVISSLRFMKSLREEILSPEVYHLQPEKSDTKLFQIVTRLLPPSLSWYGAYLFKAFPLDMSQYKSLFNTCRIPKKEKDILWRNKCSRHIVVMKCSRFYKVDVLDNDGNILPPVVVQDALRYILETTEKQSPNPVGVLTTKNRDEWAVLREHLRSLPGNDAALRDVEEAIFVLSFDDINAKHDNELALRMTLHGDGLNRWFDKSLSLIVSEDGTTALNFEHSWGDGLAIVRFLKELSKPENKEVFDKYHSASIDSSCINVKEIEFNVDEVLKTEIKKATDSYKKTYCSLNIAIKQGLNFGKDLCKSAKLSPDSVQQLAMQVAYHKVFNDFVGTYESCSTAAFKHGRTETVRSNTEATHDFCLAFNKSDRASNNELMELMVKCSKVHNQLTREAAMGNGFDRHLFALKNLAAADGTDTEFFNHPAYAKLNHNIIATSTVPADNIKLGGFGPVVPDGLGVGYDMKANQWGVVVSSYAGLRDGSAFAKAYAETMVEFEKLLQNK